MFFDWWGKHFSINAFLVHSCKLSLVYHSFIVQEKRKRVLQSCFLARNLNIHHQPVNDKDGLPHTVFGSVREFTNQPNVHGLTSPKTMEFPLCKEYCAFLLNWRLTRKKTDVKRFSSSTHTCRKYDVAIHTCRANEKFFLHFSTKYLWRLSDTSSIWMYMLLKNGKIHSIFHWIKINDSR